MGKHSGWKKIWYLVKHIISICSSLSLQEEGCHFGDTMSFGVVWRLGLLGVLAIIQLNFVPENG